MAAKKTDLQTIATVTGGAYATVQDALEALNTQDRSLSQIYFVEDGSGGIDRYFFKDGLTNNDFVKWETSGGTPAYDAYIAIVSQSSTSAPTATVLNSGDANFISGITFGRNGAGDYEIDKTGGFPANKTWISFSQGAPNGGSNTQLYIYRVNNNALGMSLVDIATGLPTDNVTGVALEIRVYP